MDSNKKIKTRDMIKQEEQYINFKKFVNGEECVGRLLDRLERESDILIYEILEKIENDENAIHAKVAGEEKIVMLEFYLNRIDEMLLTLSMIRGYAVVECLCKQMYVQMIDTMHRELSEVKAKLFRFIE